MKNKSTHLASVLSLIMMSSRRCLSECSLMDFHSEVNDLAGGIFSFLI